MSKKVALVFFIITSIVLGQQKGASPYSTFGIGDVFSPLTAEQASMGGIGTAMQQYNRLNFINPASLASLRVATYALGGQASFLSLSSEGAKQSGNSTRLQYIALGFPLGKKGGFSVGLQPSSIVGYSSLKENEINFSRYFGEGGSNRLYGGFGIKILEGLSVGFEGAFIFGNIKRTIIEGPNDYNTALATRYSEKTNLRGGEFKFGLQYKTDLSKKIQLSSGVSVKLANVLKQTGDQTMYSLRYDKDSGASEVKQVLFDKALNYSIHNPNIVNLGIGLGNYNNWYVGVNSEFHSAIDNPNVTSDSLYKYEDALKTSIGGFYIPKINSISSYWNRVTYRAGIRFENTGILAKGSAVSANYSTIKDFGINVGLGLPLPKQLSSLNLGLEYGQRGTTNNNLIKESYFNVRLSLSLNSLNWFKKREID